MTYKMSGQINSMANFTRRSLAFLQASSCNAAAMRIVNLKITTCCSLRRLYLYIYVCVVDFGHFFAHFGAFLEGDFEVVKKSAGNDPNASCEKKKRSC
jgi:hypothetical protein